MNQQIAPVSFGYAQRQATRRTHIQRYQNLFPNQELSSNAITGLVFRHELAEQMRQLGRRRPLPYGRNVQNDIRIYYDDSHQEWDSSTASFRRLEPLYLQTVAGSNDDRRLFNFCSYMHQLAVLQRSNQSNTGFYRATVRLGIVAGTTRDGRPRYDTDPLYLKPIHIHSDQMTSQDAVRRHLRRALKTQIDSYNLSQEDINKVVVVGVTFYTRRLVTRDELLNSMNAFGRFSVMILGEQYSLRKIRLHDYSCLVESLAILYRYALTNTSEEEWEQIAEVGGKKDLDDNEWRLYVAHFKMQVLTREIRKNVELANTIEVVKIFNRDICEPRFFCRVDLYRVADDQYYICGTKDLLPTSVIVYNKNHVFPVTTTAFLKLREEYIGWKDEGADLLTSKMRNFGGASSEAQSKTPEYMINSIVERTLANLLNPKNDLRAKLMYQQKNNMIVQVVGEESNEDFEQRRKRLLAARARKFEKYGWASLDFECVVNNERGKAGLGNQEPIMLTFAGEIFRFDEEGMQERVRFIPDDDDQLALCTFFGERCAEDFVRFLVMGGFYQLKPVVRSKVDDKGEPLPTNKKGEGMWRGKAHRSGEKKRIMNMWACHNGSRYDFKFLIPAFQKHMGQVDLVGTASQPKAFSCGNNFFFDTRLIFPGSLEKLARQMLPADTHEPMSIQEIMAGAAYRWGFQKMTLRDFDVEIAVTKRTYECWPEEKKKVMQVYCMQDSITCYHLFRTIWQMFYCRIFNYGVFTGPLMVPCATSASQLSMTIFKNCFLERAIHNNVAMYPYEKSSYKGALTQVWKVRARCGFDMDLSSSYPAAMFNQMPFKCTQEALITFDEITMEVLPYNLYRVKSFCFPETCVLPTLVCKLYNKFLKAQMNGATTLTDQQRQQLVKDIERNQDYSIIQPLSCDERTADLWFWGVEIQQALEQGAKIEITHVIEYEPYASHREFIQYFFQQRFLLTGPLKRVLQGKAQGSVKDELFGSDGKRWSVICSQLPELVPLLSECLLAEECGGVDSEEFSERLRERTPGRTREIFLGECATKVNYCNQLQESCKLFMNSLYGKHGQKYYERYRMGTYEECLEMATILINTGKLGELEELNLEFVNSSTLPLYEFTYEVHEDRFLHIGTTVRFASYITAVGRVNLMRGVLEVAKVLGPNSICYADTDSIFIDLPLAENEISQYRHFQRLHDKGELAFSGSQDQRKRFSADYVSFVKSTYAFKALHEIRVPDIRYLHDPSVIVPLICQEKVLGTFMIEKYIVDGYFMGPKQYVCLTCEEGQSFDLLMKIKGVTLPKEDMQRPNMDEELLVNLLQKERKLYWHDMLKMYQSWVRGRFDDELGIICGNMNVFAQVGMSIHVSQRVKVIKPCLYKREYCLDSDNQHYSRPWYSPYQFYGNMIQVKERMSTIRATVQAKYVEEMQKYLQDPSVNALSEAITYTNLLAAKGLRCKIQAERLAITVEGIPQIFEKLVRQYDSESLLSHDIEQVYKTYYLPIIMNTDRLFKSELMSDENQSFTTRVLSVFMTVMFLLITRGHLLRNLQTQYVDKYDRLEQFLQGEAVPEQRSLRQEQPKKSKRRSKECKRVLKTSELAQITTLVTSQGFHRADLTLLEHVELYLGDFLKKTRLHEEQVIRKQAKQLEMCHIMNEVNRTLPDTVLEEVMEDWRRNPSLSNRNLKVNLLRYLRYRIPDLWSDFISVSNEHMNWTNLSPVIKRRIQAVCTKLRTLGIPPFYKSILAQQEGAIAVNTLDFRDIVDSCQQTYVVNEQVSQQMDQGFIQRDLLESDINNLLTRRNNMQQNRQQISSRDQLDEYELLSEEEKQPDSAALNLGSMIDDLDRRERKIRERQAKKRVKRQQQQEEEKYHPSQEGEHFDQEVFFAELDRKWNRKRRKVQHFFELEADEGSESDVNNSDL